MGNVSSLLNMSLLSKSARVHFLGSNCCNSDFCHPMLFCFLILTDIFSESGNCSHNYYFVILPFLFYWMQWLILPFLSLIMSFFRFVAHLYSPGRFLAASTRKCSGCLCRTSHPLLVTLWIGHFFLLYLIIKDNSWWKDQDVCEIQ